MRVLRLLAISAALAATALPVLAQNQPDSQQPSQPAPAKPYKPVAIEAPPPVSDAALGVTRKKLADAAQKKDRAALARLIVSQGFFWERENGEGADPKKSGVENLSTALGLASKDGVGWDMLAGYADEPSASPAPGHAGAVCAPADPTFDGKAFQALLDATQTDSSEWGYPVAGTIDVLAAPQADAALVGKLGPAFVRVMPEPVAASASYVRVAMPDGKLGYVPVDSLAPIGGDRLCYAKEGGVWKIGGYVGGGEAQ